MAKSGIEVEGVCLKEEKGDLYSIKLGNDAIVRGKRCGKMIKNNIKVLVGDRLLVELSPYDLTRGRITYRFKD